MATDAQLNSSAIPDYKEWTGKLIPGHHVEHIFDCGDTPYFAFTDAFNIPCERALDALHVYQEFKNRTDDEYLKAFCTAKQNLYKKNPIDVFELKKLDDQLQERLNMALPPARIIEQLASVYYFDETENPYRYDRAYAAKKINKWKTEQIVINGEKTTYDFFLLKPIQNLIPSLELSEEDFQSYSKIASLVDRTQLDTISKNLSLAQQKMHSYRHPLFSNTGVKTNA